VPRLCGLYPGICLTTEEKARRNLSQTINHLETAVNAVAKKTFIENPSRMFDKMEGFERNCIVKHEESAKAELS